MANLIANSYIAIFSIKQIGKTDEGVNQLIDKQISKTADKLSNFIDIETYLDMISSVPIYEFETDKKVFSKTTYYEIPNGFELEKILHVKL